MFIAERSQAFDEAGRRDHVAAFAQHGLDEYCRDVFRIEMTREESLDLVEDESAHFAGPGLQAIGIWIRDVMHTGNHRAKRRALFGLTRRETHRAVGPPVKSTLESD